MFSLYKIDRLLDKVQESIREEEYSQALALLKEGEKISPEDPYLRMFLGMVLFHLNDHAAAKTYLEQADSVLKVDAIPGIYLGRILLAEGKPAEALVWFKSSLKKDRLHPDGHYYSGMAYLGMGKIDEATKEFEMVTAERKEFVLARILALLEQKRLNGEADSSGTGNTR
ncbi:MAG: tetratricopeptide repeat protein [Candidatus Wallbacteria bacterium]|nr:tetratricopeptide repeat protein [Candidatus Wallbacteria bacterium]